MGIRRWGAKKHIIANIYETMTKPYYTAMASAVHHCTCPYRPCCKREELPVLHTELYCLGFLL